MKFKPLSADDIECRMQQISKNGKFIDLLLYKNARVDMQMLDDMYGVLNWQRHQVRKDGLLYCIISVWDDEKKQWIEKEDVGTESHIEKEKGLVSDAFKRAATNFGIGRELYSSPQIRIWNGRGCTINEVGGRYRCYDKFAVNSITTNPDTQKIDELSIKNTDTDQIVFTWHRNKGGQKKPPYGQISRPQQQTISDPRMPKDEPQLMTSEACQKFYGNLNKNFKVGEKEVKALMLKEYGIDDALKLTRAQGTNIYKYFERKAARA